MKAPAALIALFLSVVPALAHSPVIDMAAKPPNAPFLIDEPEHSKAIFAVLQGAPDHYLIRSERDFRFYVGITAPKVEGCPLAQSFSFEVLDAMGKRLDGREGGAPGTWESWYEEWGKTWYWVGPEIGAEFRSDREYPAGDYVVKVYNDANSGEYVLAVGDVERFGLGTLLTIGGTMDKIRARFWDGCDD